MSNIFTQARLDALEEALAKGVLEVRYEDKEIRYRSVDDMLKIRDIMRNCLGLNGDSRGARRLADFSKGFC